MPLCVGRLLRLHPVSVAAGGGQSGDNRLRRRDASGDGVKTGAGKITDGITQINPGEPLKNQVREFVVQSFRENLRKWYTKRTKNVGQRQRSGQSPAVLANGNSNDNRRTIPEQNLEHIMSRSCVEPANLGGLGPESGGRETAGSIKVRHTSFVGIINL